MPYKDYAAQLAANRASYQRHRVKRITAKRTFRAQNHELTLQQRRDSTARLARGESRLDPKRAAKAYVEYTLIQRRLDQSRRKHRLRRAAGKTTNEQFRGRWEFYGARCYMCGDLADTIDHVIPLARGGTEWPANLRPACRSCNSSKGARDPTTLAA